MYLESFKRIIIIYRTYTNVGQASNVNKNTSENSNDVDTETMASNFLELHSESNASDL